MNWLSFYLGGMVCIASLILTTREPKKSEFTGFSIIFMTILWFMPLIHAIIRLFKGSEKYGENKG